MPYPSNGAISPATGEAMKQAFSFLKNSFFNREITVTKATMGSGVHKDIIESQATPVKCYIKYLPIEVVRQLQTGPDVTAMAEIFFDPEHLKDQNLWNEATGLANFQASTDRFQFDGAEWFIVKLNPVGHMEDTPTLPAGYQLFKVYVQNAQAETPWPGEPLPPTD